MTGLEGLAPVSPCARGSSCRRIGPVLAAVVALVAYASLTAGIPAASASERGAPPATLTLRSQTDWVTGPSGVRLDLSVLSALPTSRLGLNVVLYSRLGSRDAFEETLGGVEPESEYPLDSPATIPLGAVSHDGLVRLDLPVSDAYTSPARSPKAPTLSLDCASGTCSGVYPLEIVLLDRAQNVPLASLTTYLVYVPLSAGSLPLEVGLVLPVGTNPALSPTGASLLGARQRSSLSHLIQAIGAHPRVPLSLAIHGQYLDALSRTKGAAGKSLLARLVEVVGDERATGHYRHELLEVPFSAADVDQLIGARLRSQLSAQLTAEVGALAGNLHSIALKSPYLAPEGLDVTGLRALRDLGIDSVVVPPSAVTSPAPPADTPTAPFLVGSAGGQHITVPTRPGEIPRGTTEAILTDPGLSSAFAPSGTDPVLSAHQLLAELSTVYFDDPYASQPRGVVVTPQTAGSSGPFLGTVLAGLGSSPILRGATLSGLLDSVPVGANNTSPIGALVRTRPSAGPLSSRIVSAAERALDTLRSVVPSAHSLAARLEQAILLGEAADLSRRSRAAFEAAPSKALAAIGRSLEISGSRTTTLTSRSGRIPIMVQSSLGIPVHVLLRLRSTDLTFSANRSVLQVPIDLTGRASQSDIKVSTRASGSSRLEIALVSPRGDYVLTSQSIAVHSTAISGVAVALSVGAVLVLLGWWLRSSMRRRRQARREPVTSGSGP